MNCQLKNLGVRLIERPRQMVTKEWRQRRGKNGRKKVSRGGETSFIGENGLGGRKSKSKQSSRELLFGHVGGSRFSPSSERRIHRPSESNLHHSTTRYLPNQFRLVFKCPEMAGDFTINISARICPQRLLPLLRVYPRINVTSS
ncbi:hypothetical protein CDV31_017136 [Fusarium ambrosium]|uniref:Uncharacterized protein n=1 Tax=Fusarium ambrosium TaxID=131363 RepID=A0A428RRS8_9HYPO|nr:hypothetical protein CDV31_017136 [Fusarium ambrosium]